jgi:hypothetical protein
MPNHFNSIFIKEKLMKTNHFKKIILFPILLGISQVSWAACDQTLSPGANLASAISGAAAGTTICLNNGSYGNVTLSNISKTSAVTLQSATGVGATIGITLSSSNQLTLKNLTLSGLTWSGNVNTNIKVLNNTFKGQMYIYGNGNGTPQNNVIDSNTFDGINACASCYEGRLQIYGGGNLVVSNNHFGGGGDSDGIQMGGYGSVIGPGNVFENIVYMGSRHIDAIQLYGEVDHQTITSNYFKGNTDHMMAPDGGNAVKITDNVFVGGGATDYFAVITGSQSNITISHNTAIGAAFTVDAKSGSPASSNALIQDNIVLNGEFKVVCTSCNYNHNLFNTGSKPLGTNNITGTPTFTGGSSPTTLVGYQLTSGSLGYHAATDGKDMGTYTFGSVTTTALAAPTDLRTQ